MSILNLWSDGDQDITCPHCGCQFGANWDTEYGDPLQGESYVNCPKCLMSLIVDVEITTKYSTRPAIPPPEPKPESET